MAADPSSHLTGVVAPGPRGWSAECAGVVIYEGESPLDATHHARLELTRRGGGELVVLDSAGRHFRRFVVERMHGPA